MMNPQDNQKVAKFRKGDVVRVRANGWYGIGHLGSQHPLARDLVVEDVSESGHLRFAGCEGGWYADRFEIVKPCPERPIGLQGQDNASADGLQRWHDRLVNQVSQAVLGQQGVRGVPADSVSGERFRQEQVRANRLADELQPLRDERDRLQRRCDALELQMRRAGIAPKDGAK